MLHEALKAQKLCVADSLNWVEPSQGNSVLPDVGFSRLFPNPAQRGDGDSPKVLILRGHPTHFSILEWSVSCRRQRGFLFGRRACLPRFIAPNSKPIGNFWANIRVSNTAAVKGYDSAVF